MAVDTSVVLGTRAKQPLRLDIPVYVSHMSFGALSVEGDLDRTDLVSLDPDLAARTDLDYIL